MLLMSSTSMSLYAAYVAPSEIVIPDKYDTEVTATRTGDILGHTGSNVAFLLANDISVENLTIALKNKSDSSWLFTSNEASSLADISISGSTVQLFKISSGQTLAFDSMDSVEFRDNYIRDNVQAPSRTEISAGGAVYSNGIVHLSNVYDILFDSNNAYSNCGSINPDYSESYGGAVYSNVIHLSANCNVTVKNNYARTSEASFDRDHKTAAGGAFWANNIEIVNNTSICYTSNSARANGTSSVVSAKTYGGALFADKQIGRAHV